MAASRPQWDLRWGGKSGPAFNERVPVSREGRIAFGILATCFGGLFLNRFRFPLITWILGTIYATTIVGMTFIYRRDQRRNYGPPFLPRRSDKIVAWFIVVACFALTAVIIHFTDGWISRGWYKFNGQTLRRLDNPVGFWLGVDILWAIALIAPSLAIYNLIKQHRRPDRQKAQSSK